MQSQPNRRLRPQTAQEEGFSLLEMLVSVAIITVLMAIVFQFLNVNQQRYRSQQLMGEVTQGGRSAFEVMTQELNQAGYNPPLSAQNTVVTCNLISGSLKYLEMSGGSTPVTKRMFYGSRVVIGNNCAGANCNQEEVVVNFDPTYGNSPITATKVPVVVVNPHAAGEPVFTRTFPYAQGILYDNRTTGTAMAIADNKLRFFGDIMDTGDLYYGEYRLQCSDPLSTTGYTDACTGTCTTGPFVLTRFLTKLADPTNGFFKIPASKAAAYDGATVSPLVANIQGTCPTATGTAPADWVVFNAPDETSPTGTTAVKAAVTYGASTSYVRPVLNPDGTPAIWFKLNTYGAYDNSTTPPTATFQSFALDVRVILTVQQSQMDPETKTFRTQRLQTHIVPKNINNALTVANNGGAVYLPPLPADLSTGGRLPLP